MTFLDDVGSSLLFLRAILRTMIYRPWDMRSFLDQVYTVTTQSLFMTAMAGFFVGAILSLQFNSQLKEFGAISVLGGLATSATIRELGPLLIAFMLSGKVGAFTSAELGTMRVTEQIDAMRCLGTDPMEHLVLPRFLAIIVSSFFLLLSGLLTSVLGGMLLGILVGGMNADEYVHAIPLYVNVSSVLNGLFKCFAFSLVLATLCTYKGYTASGGARGVGRAVIQTALYTMVGIVLMDWFTSFIARTLAGLFYG